MKQKNCPNCGAPYDVNLNQCPYWKTSYFDMSCIDIDDREPFYLKLKTNGMVFTSKVVADPNMSIEISADSVDIVDKIGNILLRKTVRKNVGIDMRFYSVSEYKDDTAILYTMETNQRE